MYKGWFSRLKWYLQRKKPAVIITAEKVATLPNRGEGPVSEIYQPITMYFGDTVDVDWNIRLEYDKQSGHIKIWNKDRYAGVLLETEGYECTHFMKIEYAKGKR